MSQSTQAEDHAFDSLGPIKQSPDDLMDLHIGELAFKLVTRVQRLKKLHRLHAPRVIIQREKDLIRVAETAARARVRELAIYAHTLSSRR